MFVNRKRRYIRKNSSITVTICFVWLIKNTNARMASDSLTSKHARWRFDVRRITDFVSLLSQLECWYIFTWCPWLRWQLIQQITAPGPIVVLVSCRCMSRCFNFCLSLLCTTFILCLSVSWLLRSPNLTFCLLVHLR